MPGFEQFLIACAVIVCALAVAVTVLAFRWNRLREQILLMRTLYVTYRGKREHVLRQARRAKREGAYVNFTCRFKVRYTADTLFDGEYIPLPRQLDAPDFVQQLAEGLTRIYDFGADPIGFYARLDILSAKFLTNFAYRVRGRESAHRAPRASRSKSLATATTADLRLAA